MAATSFALVMIVIAAATALILGIVRIYGVIACAVTQRRREIGIRYATASCWPWLASLAGWPARQRSRRLMASLLFGTSPLGPDHLRARLGWTREHRGARHLRAGASRHARSIPC
jgi:hypothetical protein